ncbi:MAG: PD-(D/E)XK nuclease family transposase, partial [Alphaproteobacteria bacterium]|nr:PD-(D/E)XK nuclease family transposase [Alphaproteobacteria bacterium]
GSITARAARSASVVRYTPMAVRWGAFPAYRSFMGSHIRAIHSRVFEHEFAVATTDISFKQLLDPSNDKEVIISFLNTFVPTFANNPVKEVEPASIVIPSLPREGDDDRKEKATFMDLHVKSKSGASYLVEMQARRHILFDERALFYLCNTYGRQLSEAEMRTKDWYRSLKPTIAVQVLDYDSNRIRGIKDREGIEDTQVKRVREHPLPKGDYIKHYTMKDGHSGQELDHIQMVQVELPRYITRPLFPPQRDFSPVEWWLSILRHSSEYTQAYIDTLAAEGMVIPGVVKKGFERLSYHKWNPDMQKEYRLQVEDREEFEAMYAVERSEGLKEGMAKGRAEGEQKKAIEIAQEMLTDNVPLSTISRYTGLTTEEIEAIREGRDLGDMSGGVADDDGAGSGGHE